MSTVRLDTGLRVVAEAVPGVQSVALGAWVVVGARDEPSELAGVSHFLEHLLFKGTPTRTAREIAEAVDSVGGDFNAFTARECTAFYVRVPAQHHDMALDLLCEVLREPAFRPDEIEAEREVIAEEILMRDDAPDDLVHDLLSEALFPGHPLGRDILGTPSTVRAIGRDEIAAFFAEHYRAPNVVIAAAGALDPDGTVARVAAHFAADAATSPPRSGPSVAPASVRLQRRDTEQAHVAIGARSLTSTDPDRHALAVLNHVVGGGTSSRLFEEVRERRGLAYSVYSYTSGYDDSGLFGIYLGTAPARAPQALAVVRDELHRLHDGITERELAVAAGFLEGSLLLGLEDTGSRMTRLAYSEMVHGRVIPVEEQVAAYRAVTVDDVARVIDRLLAATPTLAVVGPFEESALEGWWSA